MRPCTKNKGLRKKFSDGDFIINISKNKGPRKKFSDGDFISKIHDNVLSHIFSRMPIEDAVRTSTLSKDWRYKWTSLYKLDIDYQHWEKNPESLQNFLNRTLPSFQCLRFFKLQVGDIEDVIVENHFQKWISAAVQHDLEIFRAELPPPGGIFPCTLLNSTSLRELHLMCGESTLNVAVKNVAPKLTRLYLQRVFIVGGSPTLTFTFPVLETLILVDCEWLNVKYVEIHAPSLTEVTSEAHNRMKDYDYSIVIVAPRVTTYYAAGEIPEKISVNPFSVVSAYMPGSYDTRAALCVRRSIGLRVRNQLNSFTNLEELVLHGRLAKESQSAHPFARHDKLRRLTLVGRVNKKILFELLHAAPLLKFLSTTVHKWRACNFEALDTLPACIASHIEEVVFKNFDSTTPQLDLAEFFLKNAEQLKEFRIARYLDNEEEEVIERLSTIPRCSTSTKINVVRSDEEDFLGRYRSWGVDL